MYENPEGGGGGPPANVHGHKWAMSIKHEILRLRVLRVSASLYTRDRPISLFWNRYRYFPIFSAIFVQLPLFYWPPIAIFQNLLTNILADI